MTFRSFFALYASKIRLPLNAQPGFSTGIPRRDARAARAGGMPLFPLFL